jgi:glycosyltransferase involved in cell wall biosynthesis
MVGEAMACGVPVAATDVGDVRLITGELGEVVPPKNSDLLCAAWRRLRQRVAQDADLRNKVRERIVTNYSLETMVHRTEGALSQLIAGRQAREIAREYA